MASNNFLPAAPLVAMALLACGMLNPSSTPTRIPAYSTETTLPVTITSPTLTATLTLTPTAAPPEHRIGVRVVNEVGEFYDRTTGEKFVPRGNNYVRLAPMKGAMGNLWHATLNPGFYDPSRADEALRQMHASGYNVVRIFVDCCRKSSNVGDPIGSGLSSDYIKNVIDLLEKAKANQIYVLLSLDLTPADGGYSELWQSCCTFFDGDNIRYLTPGGHLAKKRFDQDFIKELLKWNAPFEAILAFDLTNEVAYTANKPPLSLDTGQISTVNGQTYDMSKPDEKQRMMDENLVYWIDQQRAAIQELDPTALVAVSFFAPQAPHPTRLGDSRYIETRPAIWDSSADFIDLHPYPGGELTLSQYVDNFALADMKEKPIIMGEFGAPRFAYPSDTVAAKALQDWQVESCQFGFDGWLLWTWDTNEQADFYSGLGDGGLINQTLAPASRPDPCQPRSFGFFEDNLALGKPVHASRWLPDQPPSGAVDGTKNLWWGAGAPPSQWIEIDLGEPKEIRLIRLIISQSPAGLTVHQVWGGARRDQLQLLYEFRDNTTDNQVLEFSPSSSLTGIRYIKVLTTQSPSWVAWKEIEVLGP